jgi:hypothetical protein
MMSMMVDRFHMTIIPGFPDRLMIARFPEISKGFYTFDISG